MHLPPIKKLTEEVSVSGQIWPEHMELLRTQGVAALICNRPDGEEPGQPTAAALEHAATSIGLSFFHVPFAPANPSPTLLEDFSAALAEAPRPVLAFCRSGARSERLFAVTQA